MPLTDAELAWLARLATPPHPDDFDALVATPQRDFLRGLLALSNVPRADRGDGRRA